MTTIKSYTDLNQSKKLVEILPLESADMIYMPMMDIDSMSNTGFFNIPECYPFNEFKDSNNKPLPCWSLAALLDVIPDSIYDNTDEFSQLEFSKRSIAYHDLNDGIKIGSLKDNLIDACYEMIIKLKDLNLL